MERGNVVRGPIRYASRALALLSLAFVALAIAGAAWARSEPASRPAPVAALRAYLAEHAKGTRWHFVRETFASWFWPLALLSLPVASVCYIAVRRGTR